MDEHRSHLCPACGDMAARLWEGQQFAFDFSPSGAAPANSGVSKHDYPTADQAVGRDAGGRWAEIQSREAVKRKVRENGKHRTLIRRHGKGYIEYAVGGEQLIERRRHLVREANQLLRKKERTDQ